MKSLEIFIVMADEWEATTPLVAYSTKKAATDKAEKMNTELKVNDVHRKGPVVGYSVAKSHLIVSRET